MAEKQRCQQQEEGHRLCSNKCGFFGSPATNDLCSKCYRDHNASYAIIALNNSHPSSSSVAPPAAAVAVAVVVRANRCGECRKKVGLSGGFRCRCGSTYCGAHRYPESHACGFDFKSPGKESIARANPLVKADKLSHKI